MSLFYQTYQLYKCHKSKNVHCITIIKHMEQNAKTDKG